MDGGPALVAKDVRARITAAGARTAFIEPGSHRENGDVEGFNARFRNELLNGEIFSSLRSKDRHRRVGGPTTTRNARKVLWAIDRQLRKPPSRWTTAQSCTNTQDGPLRWGRSAPGLKSLSKVIESHPSSRLLRCELFSQQPWFEQSGCTNLRPVRSFEISRIYFHNISRIQ